MIIHSPAAKITACTVIVAIIALLQLTTLLHADTLPPTAQFQTPVTQDNLDPTALTQWVDGAEAPVADVPQSFIWTQTSAPQWYGLTYGDSKYAGPRYARIGFKTPVHIGTILVHGSAAVSVLGSNIAYPGRLPVASDWIPARRILGSSVTEDEAGRDDYALWVLPAGVVTRAIRLSHVAAGQDKEYAGWVGGMYAMSARYADIAPQARAAASEGDEHASKINDGTNDGTWGAWDNGEQGAGDIVSPDHPVTLYLTWTSPVNLAGLCALWAGFSAASVQAYSGPPVTDPRLIPEHGWVEVKSVSGMQNQYPRGLGPNWIEFGRAVSARDIRVTITSPTQESHPHLSGKTYGGKRVWLGEVIALSPITYANLSTAVLPTPAVTAPHAPIAIRFHLEHPGFVTLVIDNSAGKRVRNLVSETPYPAGDNVAWWDGLDDIGRDTDAASHSIYYIPGKVVAPGSYKVNGLVRPQIDLHYLMTVDNHGAPGWQTADPASQWLANHTPPSSALYLPPADTVLTPPGDTPNGQILVGSYITEGGSGLAWLNTNGDKLYGEGWIGGDWTSAPYLCRDAGTGRVPGVYAYVAAAFNDELRLTEMSKGKEIPVLTPTFKFPGATADEQKACTAVGGLAVNNGLLAASLTKLNQVLFVDVRSAKILGSVTIQDPRGLAFDQNGHLLVLNATGLIRLSVTADPTKTTVPAPLIANLQDPTGIAVDSSGNIYVTDRGDSNQVKVFAADGNFIRAIGNAGPVTVGPYDANHMNNPNGLAIDSSNRLWVAETDFQPKRVSEWTLDGKLVSAFYGPPRYGGGGELDPRDKTLFNYDGMTFKLDWATGDSRPIDVFYRAPGLLGDDASLAPQTPIYRDDVEYLTNCYSSNPTNGANVVGLWVLKKGVAVPVAAMGRANDMPILKSDAFKLDWPNGVDLAGDYWKNQAFFCWNDKNGDGKVDPDEVTIVKSAAGAVTVMPDLSFVESRVDSQAVQFVPTGFSASGLPTYDITRGHVLVAGAQGPVSTGGDQAMVTTPNGGWTVLTNAPLPYSQWGIGGAKNGVATWSYPSMWPGLHASHNAAMPTQPGELIGTTRLLGGFVTPKGSDAGPIFAINGNKGNIYLMTGDGLFVATLFKDCRTNSWSFRTAKREMLVNDASEGEEDFWPSITQTSDGQIYVTTLNACIVRVDGLDRIKRLPVSSVSVTEQLLQRVREYFVYAEAARQANNAPNTEPLIVGERSAPPSLANNLADWQSASWATIDKRVDQHGDWGHSEALTQAAVAVTADHLYAAFKTGDPKLLTNAGGTLPLFKTGGALDLMIGAGQGGERLLVTTVGKKTTAILYRPHVPGTKTEPVAFSSPLRTVKFDRVDDVSGQVQLTDDGTGNYEISVPLSTLNLSPTASQSVKGDIGILRGNGFETMQRVYWYNKSTGLVSDVPSEAELTPQLWGQWIFSFGP